VILGFQFNNLLALLIFGYNVIISSFRYLIFPNCGLPNLMILQIFCITFLILIGFPDPRLITCPILLSDLKHFVIAKTKSSICKNLLVECP